MVQYMPVHVLSPSRITKSDLTTGNSHSFTIQPSPSIVPFTMPIFASVFTSPINAKLVGLVIFLAITIFGILPLAALWLMEWYHQRRYQETFLPLSPPRQRLFPHSPFRRQSHSSPHQAPHTSHPHQYPPIPIHQFP